MRCGELRLARGRVMDRIRYWEFDCQYTAEYLREGERYKKWWAGRLGVKPEGTQHSPAVDGLEPAHSGAPRHGAAASL